MYKSKKKKKEERKNDDDTREKREAERSALKLLGRLLHQLGPNSTSIYIYIYKVSLCSCASCAVAVHRAHSDDIKWTCPLSLFPFLLSRLLNFIFVHIRSTHTHIRCTGMYTTYTCIDFFSPSLLFAGAKGPVRPHQLLNMYTQLMSTELNFKLGDGRGKRNTRTCTPYYTQQ